MKLSYCPFAGIIVAAAAIGRTRAGAGSAKPSNVAGPAHAAIKGDGITGTARAGRASAGQGTGKMVDGHA